MNSSFITTTFQTIVPLHYDIVYYMESPDNEDLNSFMRQLQEYGPLFMNTEMFPFPIKLQYVSQRELDGDYLRSQLGDAYDAEDVNEVVENMRECLSADKGGGLTARCMPSFSRDDVMEDDHAVCYCPDFGLLSAEDAFEKAKSFSRYVAEENFERLTNVSYDTYQRAKEDAQYPQRSSYGFGMMVKLDLPDPQKIKRDLQRHLSELSETFNRFAKEGVSDKEIIAAYFWKEKRNMGLKKVCKIYIKNDEIYFEDPKKGSIPVDFGRGYVPKSIYIFYLQQIELRSYNINLPKFVSQVELEKYKDVLLEIYKDISGKNNKKEKDIMSWWNKGINTFSSAVTAIKNFFNEKFDIETLKNNYHSSYLLEINGKDKDSHGNSRYGIALDIKDIDLGCYSVRNEQYLKMYRKIESESFAD